MTDEHECIWLSGCCTAQAVSGTDLMESPNGPPVGFCGACGEAFSFSCEEHMRYVNKEEQEENK